MAWQAPKKKQANIERRHSALPITGGLWHGRQPSVREGGEGGESLPSPAGRQTSSVMYAHSLTLKRLGRQKRTGRPPGEHLRRRRRRRKMTFHCTGRSSREEEKEEAPSLKELCRIDVTISDSPAPFAYQTEKQQAGQAGWEHVTTPSTLPEHATLCMEAAFSPLPDTAERRQTHTLVAG